MVKRNIGKSLVVVVVLTGFVSGASAVFGATVASQNDVGKMWKTGGVRVNPKVPVSGQPFKTAASFTSPKKMANSWDAQVGISPNVPLRKGDALVATFYIRSVSPASGGMTSFAIAGGPKFEQTAWKNIRLSNKWQKVSVPATAKGTYAAYKWLAAFNLGSMAQTVQVANFSLVKK